MAVNFLLIGHLISFYSRIGQMSHEFPLQSHFKLLFYAIFNFSYYGKQYKSETTRS